MAKFASEIFASSGFNGTSTKTRIETKSKTKKPRIRSSFNGTSTKTRIETVSLEFRLDS